MTSTRNSRFDIRKDGYDTWEIFDTHTGRTAVIGGIPRSGLKRHEADAESDYMNSEGIEPDEETVH